MDWQSLSLERLKSTEAVDTPFCHLLLEQFLPDDLYERLLQSLPPEKAYTPFFHQDAYLDNGRTTRFRIELERKYLRKINGKKNGLFEEIGEFFKSDALKEILFFKLKTDLENRFEKSVKEISTVPVPFLVRDLPGYKITPHPDSGSKVLTVIYYLAKNANYPQLGTQLHQKNLQGELKPYKLVPYQPNTLFAFAVSERSWHSVNALTEAKEARNSIQMIYYDSKLNFRSEWEGALIKKIYLSLRSVAKKSLRVALSWNIRLAKKS